MDWAKTIRALRQRLRLKQGALADLIGISQTSVSRLEAGLATPTPEVAEAIQRLREDPRTRSVFDDFVVTIRFSPFPCFLVQPGMDGHEVEAVSDQFANEYAADVDMLHELPHSTTLVRHVDALLMTGFVEGRIQSAIGSWADGASPQRFWRVIYSPIRDGGGSWYIYGTLIEVSEQDHVTHTARHDGGLEVTSFDVGPSQH